MAGAGDQRQRHGMGNVGADDAHGRHLGIEGEHRAVTPIAPAPTDDSDTSAPSTAPSAIVKAVICRSLQRSSALDELLEQPAAEDRSVTAARIRAKPSTEVMIVADRLGVLAEVVEQE